MRADGLRQLAGCPGAVGEQIGDAKLGGGGDDLSDAASEDHLAELRERRAVGLVDLLRALDGITSRVIVPQ